MWLALNLGPDLEPRTRPHDRAAARGHQNELSEEIRQQDSVEDGNDIQLYLLQAIYVFNGGWKGLTLSLGPQLLSVQSSYPSEIVQAKAGNVVSFIWTSHLFLWINVEISCVWFEEPSYSFDQDVKQSGVSEAVLAVRSTYA